MIITRTPLRIPIGGGGTDLPSYYREFGGFVISAAIVLAGALFWGFVVGRVEQLDWESGLECRS